MKYRKIGPFRSSAIAYGSMPLSIEGHPGARPRSRSSMMSWTLDAPTSTLPGPTTPRAARNNTAKSSSQTPWNPGMGTAQHSRWRPKLVTFGALTITGKRFGT